MNNEPKAPLAPACQFGNEHDPAHTIVSGGGGASAGETKLAAVLQLLMGTLAEELELGQAWRKSAHLLLETHADQLTDLRSELAGLRQDLKQRAEQDQSLRPVLEGMGAELQEALARLQQLAQAQGAQGYNLERVRLQAEALSRSFEEVSNDLMDRQVTAPLYTELACHYDGLAAIGTDGLPLRAQDQVRALADRILRFLDAQGVQVVRPGVGEPFDPKRHEPLGRRPTNTPALHNKISRTFSIGLANRARVIQPARVEVFVLEKAKN